MKSTSLVEALNHFAQTSPDKEALRYISNKADASISYSELLKLVAYYANKIEQAGISSPSNIILCLDNSPEYVGALYACWIKGHSAIPLHSQSKAREINHITKLTQAKLLITREKAPFLNDTEIQSLELNFDQERDNINSQPPLTPIELPSDLESIALILFTSGTTGNPKGVMLTHQNLLANTRSIVEYLKLSSADQTYSVLPFTYSYGNSLLQTHIFAGATLYLGQSMLYPQRIAEDLHKEGMTGFSGVPSTFQILLHKTSFAKNPPKLRYITQAGGAMNITTTKELMSLLPSTEIFVMYGQTEASARLSYLPSEKLLDKVGSIGVGIPDVELAVADREGKRLPHNQTGELIARGANIMKGYWKNPEETSKTLIDGWLHTGDIAYFDEDGFIYIQGRKKQMIKSGANRVHPEEIEEIISECPCVSEVAVTGISDELLGESIAVFIVTKKDADSDDKQIKAHCRKNLPPHKQPKQVFWVEELPKTSSGKVQRHLLENLIK